MRMSSFLRSGIAALVLAVAASASAQDPGPGGEVDAGSAGIKKATDSSGDKMFEQAKVYLQKMQNALRRGEKQREDAKQQKDLIKLNCLGEKMLQAEGHLKESEQSLSALSDAVVRNDTAERNHESSRIRIFYQKVLVLSTEADNCAGDETAYVGPSQIEVEVDPTIPQGDPTDPGLPTPNFTMPPPGVEAPLDSPISNPSPSM